MFLCRPNPARPRRNPRGGASPRAGGAIPARGFTLIELLVVTAILAVVIGVITACLFGGVRVWDTVRTFNESESRFALALRVMERDLANLVPYYDVGFIGGEKTITFATVGPVAWGEAADAAARGGSPPAKSSRLSAVRYAFSASEKRILRTKVPCDGSRTPSLEGRAEAVMEGVDHVRFSFVASAGTGGGRAVPVSEWNSRTNYPGRVVVECQMKRDGVTENIERVIVVPAVFQDPGGSGTAAGVLPDSGTRRR
jgi:prepilin-type N-terminal cleavage/methylation domain-containing protein